MKKIILPIAVLCLSQYGTAQCTEAFAIPYTIDVENTTVPQLPDCADSVWDSFSSQEEFESINGPIEGFEGKVLAYDTFAQISGVSSPVSVRLTSYTIQFEQGVEYIVGYKYKCSNENASIDYISLQVIGDPGNNVQVSLQQNVTAATATNFVSAVFTVPSSGEYRLSFTLTAQPNQGLFYMDDIAVYENGVMDLEDNSMSSITVYPNPVSDFLTISNEQQIDKLEMYTLSGQLVCNKELNALSHQIDMGNFSAGVYILHIYSGESIKKIKVYKK